MPHPRLNDFLPFYYNRRQAGTTIFRVSFLGLLAVPVESQPPEIEALSSAPTVLPAAMGGNPHRYWNRGTGKTRLRLSGLVRAIPLSPTTRAFG